MDVRIKFSIKHLEQCQAHPYDFINLHLLLPNLGRGTMVFVLYYSYLWCYPVPRKEEGKGGLCTKVCVCVCVTHL